MNCKNCGEEVYGNFCAHCGQKSDTRRFTFRDMAAHALDSLLHVRRGFPFTIKQLLLDPGHSVREYINGKRIRWYKPFPFAMLMGLVTGLSMRFAPEGMAQFQTENISQAGEQFLMARFGELFTQNYALFQLMMIPVYAFFSWLFFLRTKVNYAENIIMHCYVMGTSSVLSVVPWAIIAQIGDKSIMGSLIALTGLLAFIYQVISYVRFYQTGKDGLATVKSLVSYVLATLFVFVFLALLIVAYLMIGGGKEEVEQFERNARLGDLQTGAAHLDFHHTELWPSAYVDARDVTVCLPPDYFTDTLRRFPVIYLQDGQNLFFADSSYIGVEWEADEALEQVFSETGKSAIVVGIWNTPKRYLEYLPEAPAIKHLGDIGALPTEQPISTDELQADNYLKFVVDELKPAIDARYRTRPERKYTTIGGSSMGGLMAWYALCEYPDVFGTAVCVSTHWPGGDPLAGPTVFPQFLAYLDQRLPDPSSHRLWFDHGTETLDRHYSAYQEQVDSLMVEKGFGPANWQTHIYPGAEHSERAWQARFPEVLTFILH